MLREGNGKFEACNPGNHIKNQGKFNIYLFSCLDQPSARLQIMIVFPVLIPGQNFHFRGGRKVDSRFIDCQHIDCRHIAKCDSCRHVDCRLIARLSTIIKKENPPSPKKSVKTRYCKAASKCWAGWDLLFYL